MAKTKIEVSEGNIKDLVQDERNLNRHTERGGQAVTESIGRLGFGRSVVVDRNNKLIAGNQAQKSALDAGKTKSIIIETDGTEMIVVKRKDLDLDTDTIARELALADNATSALNLSWNLEEAQLQAEEFGFDLEAWGVVEPEAFEQQDYSGRNREIDTDGFEDKCILKLEYTLEDYETVKNGLAKHGQTPEAAVFNLLGINAEV